jgi:GT2 family glycosyltransferase
MQQAKGDYFLFLNNDVEVILPGWIKEMLMLAQQDRVGAVGCMLYYPNGDIQHGGVVVNRKSIFHLGYGLDGKIKNYNYELVREDTANTGACLMVKREKAEALNGFDTGLAQELNDVDFCLRLRKTGYSNLYTPFAKLVHYESISRGHNNFNFLKSGWADDIYFFNKWNDEMTEPDPFFNLNYQKDSPIFHVSIQNIC